MKLIKETKMNFLKSFLLSLTLILFFSSCEGYRCADGIIYDSETQLPLDSVKCVALTGSITVYSDSTGFYSLCNNFSGCVPDCPDLQVEYSKFGYKTKTRTNPNKDDIYLERE